MALGPLAEYHILPGSVVATLVVVVVGIGLYYAWTGRPIGKYRFTALAMITFTNAAVFVLQGFPVAAPLSEAAYLDVVYWNGLIPQAFVTGYQWWAPITSMFVHSGLLHIAFNMLFLWFIGGKVEYRMGRKAFIVAYLVSGLAADALTLTGAFLLPDAWRQVSLLDLPDPLVPNIGASGAVYGIIGVAMGAWPNEKVLIPTPIIATYWRPWAAALILLVLNLFIGLLDERVAWWAHLGGLAGGVIWGIRWRRKKGRRVRIDSVGDWGAGAQYSYTYRAR